MTLPKIQNQSFQNGVSQLECNINKYKAWLVAKGYTQVLGLDFINLFPLIFYFKFLRILISLASQFGLEISTIKH
jgi:hypothetical protein